MAGFQDISQNFVVKKALEGYRKQKSRADTRLPITPEILKKLVQSVGPLGFAYFVQVLLKAMYLLAFHAFLRVGEITGASLNTISRQSIQFVVNAQSKIHAAEINMEHFKHYKGKSCKVLYIESNQDAEMCPVQALTRYCELRGAHGGPLFCFSDGKPVTRQYFTQQLQLSLLWAGYDTSLYKTHSFRIGAASTAANMGISDDKIQIMGRWQSDSFKKYIRIPLLKM